MEFEPDNIIRSLRRHFSINLEDSKWFSALKSNSARVNFILKLLKKLDIEIEIIDDNKDDLKSEEIRKKANQLFKLHKDEEALCGYTESATYALTDETLSLALGNRSAVLFEKKLYRECLIDISNVLEMEKYPENLMEKLLRRKQRAEELLTSEQLQENVPTIKEKNPLIDCASSCIRIENDKELGRHVLAIKDLRVGELIAIENPFAKILLPEYNLTNCHHCLTISFNLLPCSKCTKALFCSKECKSLSNSYHQFECPLLKGLFERKVGKMSLIALRVALKSLQFGNDITTEIYHSENYREIHELMTNTEMRSTNDLVERATKAAIIYKQIVNYNQIEDSECFKENLLRHLQTAPTNFHEITQLKNGELEEIGAGAYSFLSLLNHSCCPNVIRHCYGETIVLRILRPVGKGQQLLDNYGYHFAMMSREERQKQLHHQYYFQCKCEACENNWPLYSNLPANCQEFVSMEDIEELTGGNHQIAKKLLPKLLEKLEEWEQFRPCREICDLEEILKQCYAIFANKMISIYDYFYLRFTVRAS